MFSSVLVCCVSGGADNKAWVEAKVERSAPSPMFGLVWPGIKLWCGVFGGADKKAWEEAKVERNALKSYAISNAPSLMWLHLKRFEQVQPNLDIRITL